MTSNCHLNNNESKIKGVLKEFFEHIQRLKPVAAQRNTLQKRALSISASYHNYCVSIKMIIILVAFQSIKLPCRLQFFSNYQRKIDLVDLYNLNL